MAQILKSELLEAQKLLVQLSTVLSPFAPATASPLPPVRISFFKPPETGEPPRIQLPVTLLPTLKEVQVEVSRLVETLEGEKVPARAKPESQSAEEKPGRDAPNLIAKPLPKAGRPTPHFSPLPPEAVGPAQKAIREVRTAIRLLATSSTIQEPKLEEIRNAIESIQPAIDQLIEALSRKEPPSEPIVSKHAYRFPIPQNPRAALLNRTAKTFIEKEEREKPSIVSVSRSKLTPEKERRGESLSRSEPSARESAVPLSKEGEGRPSIQERTVLPGAPFTPLQSADPTRRKKKRRLFPWEQDPEEDPDQRR